MDHVLFLVGTVILICILMNRWVEKLAVPSLLVFIALGMCFGENGLLHIQFDDYAAVNTICSVSLIFIMFYGGFGTNLTAARPVAVQSVVLSTLGVACTAGSVAVFVHLVFHLSWAESLLIGSVISSTDAASVFSILRTKKLALKEHTDSLLELESGSNDPISYMLTSVAVAVLTRQEISVPLLLLQQIAFGCRRRPAAWSAVCLDFRTRHIPVGSEPNHLHLFYGHHRLRFALCAWRKRLPQRLPVRHLAGAVQLASETLLCSLL